MLQTTFLEFLLRGIPEAFLLILSSYIFSKKRINIIEFLLFGFMLAIVAYIIRFLPIHYGVHTVLNVFAFLVICILGMKNNYLTAMKNTIFIFISQSLCEAINILVVKQVFGINMGTLFQDSYIKLLYGIPSTIMLCLMVLFLYLIMIKRGQKSGDII